MLFVAVISNKGPHFKLDFQITDNTVIVCSNCVEVHFKAIKSVWQHSIPRMLVVLQILSQTFCVYILSALSVQESQICLYVTPTLSVCAVVIEYIYWKECLVYVVE